LAAPEHLFSHTLAANAEGTMFLWKEPFLPSDASACGCMTHPITAPGAHSAEREGSRHGRVTYCCFRCLA